MKIISKKIRQYYLDSLKKKNDYNRVSGIIYLPPRFVIICKLTEGPTSPKTNLATKSILALSLSCQKITIQFLINLRTLTFFNFLYPNTQTNGNLLKFI